MAKHFSVDARAMLTWGRESIRDHTTAVLELVKNSYDAGAKVVEVSIWTGLWADGGTHIRIADNGSGMSWSDVEIHWLRLGFSGKREDRLTPSGRRKTGEKGIGRISADRLGSILELRSQAHEERSVGLAVDWREFETPGQDLENVAVQELADISFLVPQPSEWDDLRECYTDPPPPTPNSSSCSGTELVIRDLRQEWNGDDVKELRRMLSLLASPFDTVRDFQVRILTDIDPALNGVVQSPLWAAAAIEGEFSLASDGTVNIILSHRSPDTPGRVKTAISVPFDQFVHPKVRQGTDKTPSQSVAKLGPVTARLMFYPQKTDRLITGLSLSELREFLSVNAGIKVYRDGIRVPPYGDLDRPEGDWLGLGDRKARNPAGPARIDFRVSPHQLAGAVFIGRDTNPQLVDTSGREGLVSGPILGLLKSFLLGCLTRLERQYHKIFISRVLTADERTLSPRTMVDELRTNLTDLAKTIQRAEETLPGLGTDRSAHVLAQLASTTASLKNAEKAFEELSSQAGVSRTLATIGIAAATFGHETQSGLDSVKATLATVRILLNNKDPMSDVLSELEKAVREAEKVAAWGGFALGRVRRDRRVRRHTDIAALVNGIVKEMKPAMEASTIDLTSDLTPVRAKVFAMDVECVVINLLANAYYFSTHSPRERRIAISVQPKTVGTRNGFELKVADSGPGVAPPIREQVWEPLFTTKTNEDGKEIGTGLGLALVNSVVQDTKGIRSVDADPQLGGARFCIWLPDADS